MLIRTLVLLALTAAAAAAQTDVAIHFLKVEQARPPVLSNLDPVPGDLGVQGARLGVVENNTTGRFLGQSYALSESAVAPDGDALAAARAALAETPLLVLEAPAEALAAIADLPEAEGALLFNAGSGDAALRGQGCRANLLHALPSTAMRTDALAQFLVRKRWERLAMVVGPRPEDQAFAESMRASLRKFGLKLRQEKPWLEDADIRRSASTEVPLFTQGLGEYDALILADEARDFGRYILYNTWEPRPVAGSEGLVPVAWSRVVEQWGAAQLQSRFEAQAGRAMRDEDYAAWAAVRAIGEAVTRTGAADPATLRAYLLGPEFELGGFKGRPLSFRPWNGQMRQPIPLVHPRAVVAQAPLEGFLHQRTELDTLGIDEGESTCERFTQ